MTRVIRVIFCFFLSLLFTSTFSQSLIRVLDKHSGQGLPFANVCFETLEGKNKSYATTGTDGTLVNPVKSVSVMAVSYVGYKAEIDTIRPGKSIDILMEVSSSQVDEVVVTGQFKAQLADKSVYKVDVIGGNQIEAKAASTLGDLLSSNLSFRTNQSSAIGTSLSIQGLQGEVVKILIDGVPVVGRADRTIDIGQLNLDNVDHVEIVKGPMSVVYGSSAMAGAINIITKSGSREKFVLGTTAYYESVGVYNADLDIRQKFKKSVFSLNGSRHFFGGYSPINMGRFQLWKPKLQYSASADWLWNSGPWKTKLTQSWFREEIRDKGPLRAPFYENAIDYYYYTTRSVSRADITRMYGEKAGLDFTIAWSYYQKVKKTVNNDLVHLVETPGALALQDTTQFHNLMCRPIYHSTIGSTLEYQAGFDLNYDDVVGRRIEGKKSIGDLAGFYSMKWSPMEYLAIQPGIRLIYNTKFEAPLVYSINFLTQPLKNTSFRASVGRGYRSPSIKELYLVFQDINHNVSGNENLQPESSWNYNFSGNGSVTFGETSLSGEISLFQNRMQNKIDFLFKTDDPTWAQYYNIPGLSKTQGIETILSFALHPRFRLNIGGNLTGRSKVLSPDKFYYYTDYSCDWTYHNLKYDFVLAMFYKFTDKEYFASGTFDVYNNLTSVEESYQDGYQTIDITLSRPFFKNKLNVTIGGKNLLDVKNILATGGGDIAHSGGGSGEMTAAWGRTYFVKCAWKFSKF